MVQTAFWEIWFEVSVSICAVGVDNTNVALVKNADAVIVDCFSCVDGFAGAVMAFLLEDGLSSFQEMVEPRLDSIQVVMAIVVIVLI